LEGLLFGCNFLERVKAFDYLRLYIFADFSHRKNRLQSVHLRGFEIFWVRIWNLLPFACLRHFRELRSRCFRLHVLLFNLFRGWLLWTWLSFLLNRCLLGRLLLLLSFWQLLLHFDLFLC